MSNLMKLVNTQQDIIHLISIHKTWCQKWPSSEMELKNNSNKNQVNNKREVDLSSFPVLFLTMRIFRRQVNSIFSVVVLIWVETELPPCFCPSDACWQGRAKQPSRLSRCLFVSPPPSLSLMCQSSRAGVGQAAMSISSIHQAVGRVAERGWRAAEKGQMFCRNWYVFTSTRDVITRRTEKHVAD